MKLMTVILLAAVLSAGGKLTGHATESGGAKDRRPVILLVHGGAWLAGSPDEFSQTAVFARRQGLQPVLVDYPLGSIVDSNEAVRREAAKWRRAGRTVIAYGESAGGSMVELLAAECRVDLAVGNSAPNDLVELQANRHPSIWDVVRGGDIPTRRKYSAYRQGGCKPVLAMHSPTDELIPFYFARRYAARYRNVSLLTFPGGHIAPPVEARRRQGIRWLIRHLRPRP